MMLPRRIVCGLIWLYQHTLSLDHGPLKKFVRAGLCRFHPTCSEYGRQAIMKYGVIRGTPRAAWRVLRCNPWSRGGPDPLT